MSSNNQKSTAIVRVKTLNGRPVTYMAENIGVLSPDSAADLRAEIAKAKAAKVSYVKAKDVTNAEIVELRAKLAKAIAAQRSKMTGSGNFDTLKKIQKQHMEGVKIVLGVNIRERQKAS